MLKTVIFDTDGMVTHREIKFSQRFSQEFGVPMEKILPFFENEFQQCLVGKTDLKQELAKYLSQWNWQKSVGALLTFWFEHERTLDRKMLENVTALRNMGVRCFLATNNEKYRVRYLFVNLGLKDFFDGVFSSAELGFRKPQLEFWFAIYDRLGTPDKSEVLVWDDDEENVRSAKKFGFHSEYYSGLDAYKNRMKLLFASPCGGSLTAPVILGSPRLQNREMLDKTSMTSPGQARLRRGAPAKRARMTHNANV